MTLGQRSGRNACTLASRFAEIWRETADAGRWLGLAANTEGRRRACRVARAARRQDALEDDDRVGAETQMRDAHGFDGGRDRARIDEVYVLAHSPQRDVRAERFGVERDLSAAKLGAYALAECQQRRSTGADPQPDHPRSAGRRKTARPVHLDVERGNGGRGGLDSGGHIGELLVQRPPEERQRDVQELGFYASQRRKIRCAAECRFGDLGGEWERDEESYPRRLEPRGVRLVSDK